MADSILLDEKYWEDRYQNEDTPWDTGSVTTPFVEYFSQDIDKQARILIPGAGSAHEAEYLFRQGFEQVFVLDIADSALKRFQARYPDFPSNHLIKEDFFNLKEQFDLILEQTFFCALLPEKRHEYFSQMAKILKPGGKLLGVLFCNTLLNRSSPPFGATSEEYQIFFGESKLNVKVFAPCHNSIAPRQGSEYFFVLQKPTI